MNKQHIEELRQKYINNPPEGMSRKDIREPWNICGIIPSFFSIISFRFCSIFCLFFRGRFTCRAHNEKDSSFQ